MTRLASLTARLRRLAARITRFLRPVFDKLPPTPLALCLGAAATGAVLYYGQKRQDLVLYVTGLGVAGLGLVAQVLVSLTTLLLWLAMRRTRRALGATGQQPARVEAGTLLPTGFSVAALGWLPLITLRWEWIEPAEVTIANPIERGRLVEQALYRERGSYRRIVRRLVVGDVFGLARLAFRVVEEKPRVVLPARGRPLSAPILEAMAGGDNISHPLGPPDGDLVEMRRYVAGDPMKRILWKTYARTRTLMVRLPERAFSPTRRTLAYLVASPADEPAAGVARLAVETQAFGPDWRFGADGSEEIAKTVPEAVELIIKSREARDRGGQGFGSFLERASELGAFRCVLFVPPRLGNWVEHVEKELRRRPGIIEVIVGTDGVREKDPRDRWRRFLLRAPSEPERAVDSETLRALCDRLGSSGARISVIDRQTGRFFGGTLRRRAA